jgi:outer membrane protein assembly factor BamB
VALVDALYAASGDGLLKLDPKTGRADPGFTLDEAGEWNDVLVVEDLLVASAGDRVVGIDRHTGKSLWKHEAAGGLRVNSLAAGGGKVFCLEGSAPEEAEASERRGEDAPAAALVGLDARTGDVVWRADGGTGRAALAYSEEHDIVLLGFAAYRGADGSVLRGGRAVDVPNILHGDTLYTQHKKGYNEGTNPGAYDLLTGETRKSRHPITGAEILWYFARSHGCGDIVGSHNLLLFRSSSAAYYDISNDGGVTQLVGFRSSCVPSMIAADGIVSSPNLSSCACNYPVFTPLALIHDPEAEAWSHYKVSNTPEVNQAYREAPGFVKRVGLNFGAPGDRRTEEGTLWLDYPSIGGWSFDIPVTTDPESPEWFRYHSSRVTEGEGLTWVQASGARDLRSITMGLRGEEPHSYTVRVYYAEPVGDDEMALCGRVDETKGVRAGGELKWTFGAGKMVCGIELVEGAGGQG